MRAFPHGDHVVFDGSRAELERVATIVEGAREVGDADDAEDAGAAAEAAGRIRRGLDAGATRIAVAEPGARRLRDILAAQGAEELAAAVDDGLGDPDE